MKLPKFPKINVPDAVRDRFINTMKNKGMLAALQLLTPLQFNVIVEGNVTFKGEKHDIAFLFEVESHDMQLFGDPKELEMFIYQLLYERNSDLKILVEKVRYDKKHYYGLFIDRPAKKQNKKL